MFRIVLAALVAAALSLGLPVVPANADGFAAATEKSEAGRRQYSPVTFRKDVD